jgi:hypothetical protein
MSITLEASKKIKTFFFIKQGMSKATVTLNKDVFVDNEKAIFDIDIDNTKCDKNIEKIKICLRRKVFMTKNSH